MRQLTKLGGSMHYASKFQIDIESIFPYVSKIYIL